MLFNSERPTDLSQVVGQETVLPVLKEQCRKGEFSHTYLLYGHHGCGKTTIARILSRAVECEHPTENGPCGECAACKLSLEGAVDIVELDAASHNGVDDIRGLIEGAGYMPTMLKAKCIIIDEVHMLSVGAFNALLKTLEEPPESCYFFLCTTEFQKVPATIRSRCQKYCFTALTEEQLAAHLQKVATKYGRTLERDAAIALADAAGGAARDALGLLDQLFAEKESEICYADVQRLLGTAGWGNVATLLCHMAQGEASEAVDCLEKYVQTGQTVSSLIDSSQKLLSEVLVLQQCGTVKGTEAEKEAMLSLAEALDEERVFTFIERFGELKVRLRNETNPYLGLQTEIISLSVVKKREDELQKLVDEVASLRKELNLLKQNGVTVSALSVAETPQEVQEETQDTQPDAPESPESDFSEQDGEDKGCKEESPNNDGFRPMGAEDFAALGLNFGGNIHDTADAEPTVPVKPVQQEEKKEEAQPKPEGNFFDDLFPF